MLNFGLYQRTINAYATDYYLKNIQIDFGLSVLQNAINSVQKHMIYYQSKGNSAQRKIAQICQKYQEIINVELKMDNLLSYRDSFEREVNESLAKPAKLRRKNIEQSSQKPESVQLVTSVFKRNPDVVAEVLVRAAGVCETCKKPAPFKRAKDNSPYLEVHHIIRLADGGFDNTDNAIAICPNCHREAHYGA